MVGFRSFTRAAVAGLLATTTFAQNLGVKQASFSVNDNTTVFSVNMPLNSSDLYMTIIHPAYSWGAYGIGSSMKDAVMFVFYQSKSSSNLTISPRTSPGNVEPTYNPGITFELINGAQNSSKGYWYFSIKCMNCRTWAHLDPKDTAAKFIFAYGPDQALVSDSPSANLHQHDSVATFSMDMTKAADSGPGGAPSFVIQDLPDGGFKDGKLLDQHKAGDHVVAFHAWIGVFAILIVLPAGSIYLIMFKSLMWHIINAVFFFLLFLASVGLGIADSLRYNQTNHFNTPHQVLGLVATAMSLVLALLPLIPKIKTYPRLHSWGGRLFWVLAVIVGGLGIKLSGTGLLYVTAYIAVILISTIVLLAMHWIYNWRKTKTKLNDELKRGEEIELQIRRIQEIRAEREPPPAYNNYA